MVSVAVHSKVVGSLFSVALIVCRGIVFGTCFVVQYLVSCLVLQTNNLYKLAKTLGGRRTRRFSIYLCIYLFNYLFNYI